MKNYQHILLSVDLESDGCESLVARSVDIAEKMKAELTLLHSMPKMPSHNMQYLAEIEQVHQEEKYQQEAAQQLVELGAKFGIPTERQFTETGITTTNLITYAKKINVDLIIMCNSSHHWRNWLTGQEPSSIINEISCDLLALRYDDA